MKRILVVLLAAVVLRGVIPAQHAFADAIPGGAEQAAGTAPEMAAPSRADEIDFSAFSLEELLALKERVNEEIANRGVNTYYDIRRGDKGEAVAAVQERLKALGYYSGPISGKYDTETQKAMKQFEKKNNLENDGNASREDQALLFSEAAEARDDDIQPEPAGEAPETEAVDGHAEYGDFDYAEVFRFADQHVGDKVKLIGRVVQVLGGRSEGFQVRLATAGSSDVVYVFINDDPGYNILENDRLTVYGSAAGTITYESLFHQSITIPAVIADEVILR